jgi:hypothetical protein
MTDAYQEIIITKWDQWKDEINSLKPNEWVFRGQADSTWKLETTIDRHFEYVKQIASIAGLNRNDRAERMLKDFKRGAHLYLKNLPKDTDILEWYAIMQHYQAPTRMLDITFSSNIALYFALNGGKTECAVFAFNRKNLEKVDRNNGIMNLAVNLFKDKRELSSFIHPYNTKMSNERQMYQRGAFLVPSNIYETFDEILSRYPKEDNCCKKFIIEKSLRKEGLKQLLDMNITSRTLFPGLDGYCRSLHEYYTTLLQDIPSQ